MCTLLENTLFISLFLFVCLQESDYVHKQATKLQEYFLNQVKWANPDALSIWDSISEEDTDSTKNNGPTDQRPSRRSSRR